MRSRWKTNVRCGAAPLNIYARAMRRGIFIVQKSAPICTAQQFVCDQQFRVNVHQYSSLSGCRVEASTVASHAPRQSPGSEAPGSTGTIKFSRHRCPPRRPQGLRGCGVSQLYARNPRHGRERTSRNIVVTPPFRRPQVAAGKQAEREKRAQDGRSTAHLLIRHLVAADVLR